MGRKNINMKNKQLFTIGVEEEFMICHPENYSLINKANDIINTLDENEKERFSYELLLSEIEANTPICSSVNNAMAEISKNRKRLREIGNKLGFKIGISGTHPTALPEKQEFVKNESYNWVRSQLKEYARQNITFSTHVHIGLDNNENIIKVMNFANGWIAPFLALSVNSPFFGGIRTGMMSSRSFQFGIFPRTHVLQKINNYDEFKYIVDKLKLSNSIEKPRHLWWKIRPHIDFSTIEFRICDIQRSLAKTKMIISLTQALVHRIYKDIIDGKPSPNYNMEFINDSIWKASTLGVDGNLISPINEKKISMKEMVYSMLDYIHPSLVYFGTEKNIKIAEDILEGYSEANEQIEIFNREGFEGLNKFLVNNVEFE